MSIVKITKRVVEAIAPGAVDIIIWDAELKGFGCKITPLGRRSYVLLYRTLDGRQRKPTIGVHGEITPEEARAKAKRWLVDVSDGKDPSADRQGNRAAITFKDFSDKYLADYAKSHKKESSYEGDKRYIETDLIPRWGKKRLASINRADVQRLHASMSDSPISANRLLALASTMFALAQGWGLYDGENPCRYVKKYREQGRKRFLNPDELARLAAALAQAEHEAVVSPLAISALRLLIFTGCRLREILHLAWADVDMDGKRLHLADSKTGKRTVLLNPAAVEILKGMKHKSLWVFPGKEEKPLDNMRKSWAAVCKKAKLTGLHVHDLRHVFATVGAGLGLGLPIIGDLLGHRKPSTTAIYAHVAQDPARAASDAIAVEIQRMIAHGSEKVVEIDRSTGTK